MSEVDALQTCLAAEHATCYGYGVLGGVLAGPAGASSQADRRTAERDYAQHIALRDQLVDLIRGLGATPVAAQPAYQTPFPVRSADSCRRLARLLENRCSTVYAYAVSQTTTDSRTWTAEQVAAATVRSLAWGATATAFPGITDLPA